MKSRTENRSLSATSLYRLATRLHGALPCHLSPWGHAFPAWHYFLEVTRRCNLRCTMCQYRRWYERTPADRQMEGELTTEEWKNVIDQTGRFSLITFTGGEPFLRDDFMDLLEHAARKRRAHFITNGIRITDEVARRCVELAPGKPGARGLNFAGFSLHGTRDVHNAVSLRDDAYDKTLEAIGHLARHRKALNRPCPLIHVTAVIQEGNLAALPQLPALLAAAGADCLNLTLEIRFHDLPGLGEADPDTLRCAEVATPRIPRDALVDCIEATQSAAREVGIELRLPRMPIEEIVRYYSGVHDDLQDAHAAELTDFECRSAWTNLYVGADGSVYPCFIQKVGDVRSHALKAIWNGTKMRNFRMRLRQGGPFCICDGCCELEYKGRGCPSP